MAVIEQPLSQLRWQDMSELGWWDLVGLGLPSQLAELAVDMSRRAGRRLRVYVMPTLDAGVAGLALPFLEEDGILFDPSLLDHSGSMADVIAHELAYLLYPGWADPRLEQYVEMQEFASLLGPIILDNLPTAAAETDPMVELVLCNQLAA
ncbi:MAG TPA: hypothetical protein VG476_09945 [Acidimicrobiales bacterium]|nr:hypothetical protein [Acidimicrobiales bacterium]